VLPDRPDARAARDPRPPARPAEAPYLGVGVGLRPPHYGEVLRRSAEGRLGVDWLEAISENYMIAGGRPLRILSQVRAAVPLVLHGVSLNLGSTDPQDAAYLDELAALAARFEPIWLSDHLCWTGVGGHNLHDLLPLPYTEEAVRHLARRIRRTQERLDRRIALENVSAYVAFADSSLPEWEFLSAVAEEADCGILLDVNNVLVSAHNFGFDAQRYVDAIDPARIFQIHLAGPSEHGPLLIDTHDHPVREEAWALYARLIERTGPVSTLVEWDANLPSFERLCQEAGRARSILAESFPEPHERPGPHAAETLAAAHGA
jgi:uncharacterized protein (UPF0276 family)